MYSVCICIVSFKVLNFALGLAILTYITMFVFIMKSYGELIVAIIQDENKTLHKTTICYITTVLK